MGTVWNAGMRDEAAGGLAHLLTRPVWRDSRSGPALRDAVTRLVTDESPLVRMRAARGWRALHGELDPVARTTALGGYIMAESDGRVLAVLLFGLAGEAAAAPEKVDAVLAEFASRPAGTYLTTHAAAPGANPVAPLLAYLAAVPQTPFASDLLAGWVRDAVTHHKSVTRLVHSLGRFLNSSDGRGQRAAFALLESAAVAARERWQDLQGRQSDETPSDPDALAELRAAATVVDDVAEQIHRASGASDAGTAETKESAPRGDARRFAEFAVPVLETCAGVPSMQCIHAVVQTLVHLAPLSEKRMLLAVAAAVPERNRYATDPIAGRVVLPYLQRLLAEQRALVLRDPDGLSAFRHLLQTFAAAGNEQALALAYSFADVFR